MIRNPITISSIALLILACDRGQSAPEPATAATQAPAAAATQAPTTTTTNAPEPAAEIAAIAVEEEFEAEAETRVSATNLQAALAELEKEIDGK